MIQDQNILNHPSILLSFYTIFSPSFSATFSVFFLVSGVLVTATGQVPQGWKEAGKEEEGPGSEAKSGEGEGQGVQGLGEEDQG